MHKQVLCIGEVVQFISDFISVICFSSSTEQEQMSLYDLWRLPTAFLFLSFFWNVPKCCRTPDCSHRYIVSALLAFFTNLTSPLLFNPKETGYFPMHTPFSNTFKHSFVNFTGNVNTHMHLAEIAWQYAQFLFGIIWVSFPIFHNFRPQLFFQFLCNSWSNTGLVAQWADIVATIVPTNFEILSWSFSMVFGKCDKKYVILECFNYRLRVSTSNFWHT